MKMNKKQAKNQIKKIIDEQYADLRHWENVNPTFPQEKNKRVEEINKHIQALNIAIESLEDEVEELEKMESKALEDYSEEAIKKAVNKFSKTIKQINNRIQGKDNEWVDVRDRLPRKEDWYLTTHEHGEVKLHYFTFSGKKFVFNHSLEPERRTPVIAWKPLPQPYERKE